MYDAWNDHEWEDEGGWSTNAQEPELSFGDPDAWRGSAYGEGADAWRGTDVVEEWPECDAGPEYLMWKRKADDE